MAIYSEFSHEKWWFSIAMLNYQRVVFFFLNIQFKTVLSWKKEPRDCFWNIALFLKRKDPDVRLVTSCYIYEITIKPPLNHHILVISVVIGKAVGRMFPKSHTATRIPSDSRPALKIPWQVLWLGINGAPAASIIAVHPQLTTMGSCMILYNLSIYTYIYILYVCIYIYIIYIYSYMHNDYDLH